MSNDKATPRPWSVGREFNVFDGGGRCVVSAGRAEASSYDENVANAELIVRAVNNHDALIALLSNLHSHLDGYDMGGTLTMKHRISDAIKSATGMNVYEYKAKKRDA